MRITPKSDSELAEGMLLLPGQYPCRVSFAEDTTSKRTGAEMIHVKLTVFANDGSERIVQDWLMEAVSYKLKAACKAFGIIDKYESGELLARDLLGREGYVELKIDEDKTGQYGPKNAVKTYRESGCAPRLPKPAAQPEPRRRPTVEEMQRTPAPVPPPAGSWEASDDDIPF